ncbi:MAG: 3-deoxy-7-phosphoheptulonate synthase [Agathobacter sp.]|uniref:3-deoxy-7-phosphoheptulonate synthase n=1 Tax=Agathobacter sp. TaxID=2021311 RepID=UPI0025886EC6|nr:3-deoxy-7-phosphoheptulonate synthase [Agathobacter sp.]MCR5678136.1 3-deoxy-7-phosphoheptulonate synthase [Agathobacter sp.]
MKLIRRLPGVEELRAEYALSEEEQKKRIKRIKEIKSILCGKSAKKLVIVGPCSADREDAVLDYVQRLSELQEMVKDAFVLVPRVYTGKPRTSGTGYKGMLHRPQLSSKEDDLVSGIIAVRQLHQKIIKETGMFVADELLYPNLHPYYSDLLVYMAVGARSVEDQDHRLAASGLDIPVGMKNPTSGDISIMLNAVYAAQQEQMIVYDGWEAHTEGNKLAHSILRGYTNVAGECIPNYYYENLIKLHDSYYKSNLENPAVIIDCNHANSNKQYLEQIRIANEVAGYCAQNKEVNNLVKGLMIESYLEDGTQMVGQGVYGKSITDPCLGWEKTKTLLLTLQEKFYEIM